MTITEFREAYQAGEFDAPDRETQMKAGWTHWACQDSSLVKRLKPLAVLVCKLTGSHRLRPETTGVSFLNTAVPKGRMYDSILIHDCVSSYMLWRIDRRDDDGIKWEVWTRDNGFMFPVFLAGRVDNVAKWLNEGLARKSTGEILARTCHTCRHHTLEANWPLPAREDCRHSTVRLDAERGKPVERLGLDEDCPFWGVHRVTHTAAYSLKREDFGQLKMPGRSNNETWFWTPNNGWVIPGFPESDVQEAKTYKKLKALLDQEGGEKPVLYRSAQ